MGDNNDKYKVMMILPDANGEKIYRSVSKDKIMKCPPNIIVLYNLELTSQYNGQGGIIKEFIAETGRYKIELLTSSTSNIPNIPTTTTSETSNKSTTTTTTVTTANAITTRPTIISVSPSNMLQTNEIISNR